MSVLSKLTRRSFVKSMGVAGGAVVLAACGGGSSGSSATTAPAAQSAVTLDIGSVGNEIKWDKETLEAPANSKITLNLKNNAAAGSGMIHNWALVKSGTEEAVSTAGLAAGEATGYLKEGDANVLAKTGLTQPATSSSVTFDAPAPGAYPYICSFPGHNVLMKGILTIK